MRSTLLLLAVLVLVGCAQSPAGMYSEPPSDRTWDFRETGYLFIEGFLYGKWSAEGNIVSVVQTDGSYGGTYMLEGDKLVLQDAPSHILVRRN